MSLTVQVQRRGNRNELLQIWHLLPQLKKRKEKTLLRSVNEMMCITWNFHATIKGSGNIFIEMACIKVKWGDVFFPHWACGITSWLWFLEIVVRWSKLLPPVQKVWVCAKTNREPLLTLLSTSSRLLNMFPSPQSKHSEAAEPPHCLHGFTQRQLYT